MRVQEQLKALHETRHAGFLAGGREPRETEAGELAERFDARRLAGDRFSRNSTTAASPQALGTEATPI